MSLLPRALGGSALGLWLAGAAVLPAVARAEPEQAEPERAEPRLHLGLRTGFGLPLGHYAAIRTVASFRNTDVNALSDDTYGAIPIWLDVGYRWSAHWMFGVYAMAGLVLPKTAETSDPLGGGCPDGLECSAFGVRLGLQAQYRFAPGESLDPWLGLGIGYEWIWSDLEGEVFSIPVDASNDYAGPDLAHVQGGLDIRVSDSASLGPFLSLSAMRYTSCTATISGDTVDCELDEQSWHGWLMLGVRGALEL
jgi:hypothetical protein